MEPECRNNYSMHYGFSMHNHSSIVSTPTPHGYSCLQVTDLVSSGLLTDRCIARQICQRKINGLFQVQWSHLQYVSRTIGPGCLCRGPKSSVMVEVQSRPAVNDLSEGFSEVVAQEGVQYRVHAAVHVGQHVAHYLSHYRRHCQWILVQRFKHQYYLEKLKIITFLIFSLNNSQFFIR